LQMPQLVMENGAGLSRHISISAAGLSQLLVAAASSAYHPEFMASFSLGGMDGTMKKRLKKLDLGGRARLKTGYVKGIRTLAGYIRSDSGQDYAVVLFLSDARVNFSNGNIIQDEFIKWVLKSG
jgi:D-alanyl-D-alanine carboxypeptidase/D-alanyl-D-alanine-endopeptidase (penicillin-binding protein 4)